MSGAAAEDESASVCLPDDVWPVGKKAALYSAFVVFGLGLFDFVDRQVLASVIPHIKQEWELSDTQLGMLVSVVNISIAVLVVPSAYLVDRWSRRKMLCIMGTVWSLATGACALAGTYGHLLLARACIGAGEAGYVPGSVALLSAQFPKRLRATAVAVTQIGVTIGVPLGVVIGAFIAEHWGWRHAFGIVMVPGLILAVMALFARDYRNVPAVSASAGKKQGPSYGSVLAGMLRTPSLLCVFFSAVMLQLFNGAVMNWMPSYFLREAGLPLTTASTLAAMVLVASIASTVLAGPLIDFARRRRANGTPLVLAGGLLLGGGLFFTAFSVLPAGSAVQVVTLMSAFLCTSLAVAGNTLAAVELAAADTRAAASSLLVFSQNVFGFALGPVVVGLLSDTFSLGTALIVIAYAPLLAGLSYVICNFTYVRDMTSIECRDMTF